MVTETQENCADLIWSPPLENCSQILWLRYRLGSKDTSIVKPWHGKCLARHETFAVPLASILYDSCNIVLVSVSVQCSLLTCSLEKNYFQQDAFINLMVSVELDELCRQDDNNFRSDSIIFFFFKFNKDISCVLPDNKWFMHILSLFWCF